MATNDVQFLHRLDFEKREGLFVTTTASRLRTPPFLDGRKRFWDEECVRALPVTDHAASPRPAYIFHVSFCGSTLLATLLDLPGSVLALKEPHALVDASDWAGGNTADAHALPGLLRSIECCLVKPAAAGEAVVLKPSNWANNLLPYLCTPQDNVPAIFVSMPCRDFLKAVFRGGRERMAYTARAAQHLASTAASRELFQQAIAGGTEPLDRIARIAALLHHIQERLFQDAMDRCGWGKRHMIGLDQLLASPVETVLRAASALSLQFDETALEERIVRQMSVNAKGGGERFSADQRVSDDREVERHHGKLIDRAANWSDAISI